MPALCTCVCGRRWSLEVDLATHCGELSLACPTCGAGAIRLMLGVPEAATLPPVVVETATLPPRDLEATVPPAFSTDDEVEAQDIENEDSFLQRYEILSELGRGGMGVVYRAKQRGLNRVVALKMILAGGHAGSDEIERFRIEAEAIARLRHPGIVQVYEIGEQNGQPYFSLEFCDGGSLAGKLRGKPLKPHQAAAIVEALARAMQAAHEAGILHRDLKPGNVLLSRAGSAGEDETPAANAAIPWGVPKITDFGLAKKLDEQGQGKTRTGAIMGTPSYMAPEQAQGLKDISPACDIYALGAILYECLTGRPPFQAATSLDTVLQVLSEEPVPPRQLNSKVPRDLEVIALKCLHKEPRARYDSARALADDLKRYLKGEPIKARPAGMLGRTWRTMRKRPIYAAFAVLLCGSVLFSVYEYVRAKDLFRGFDWEELGRIKSYLLAEDPVKAVPKNSPPGTNK